MAESLFDEYVRLLEEARHVTITIEWGDPVYVTGLMDRRLCYEPTVTMHTEKPDESDLPTSGTTD